MAKLTKRSTDSQEHKETLNSQHREGLKCLNNNIGINDFKDFNRQ